MRVCVRTVGTFHPVQFLGTLYPSHCRGETERRRGVARQPIERGEKRGGCLAKQAWHAIHTSTYTRAITGKKALSQGITTACVGFGKLARQNSDRVLGQMIAGNMEHTLMILKLREALALLRTGHECPVAPSRPGGVSRKCSSQCTHMHT